LRRIVAGVESADAGHIQFAPSDLRIGYLPQGLSVAPDETLGAFLARGRGEMQALSAELERLAGALTTAPARADLQAQYDSTLARLSAAAEAPAREMEALAALGLGSLSADTPGRFLSGGAKRR